MAEQLTFDLAHRTARGRADFFVSPANALAVAQVDAWQAWPGRKLVLTGPAGAGKTHLAHVWAARSGARIVSATTLAMADIPALCRQNALAVEDADRIAGEAAAETALFHLHNHLLGAGGALLLTGRSAPARWPINLPDLRSRVLGAATAALQPPDDALLAAILAKQFADRQLAVPPGLIDYLVARMERSAAAAGGLVAALDARALAGQRPISLRLAAEVLDNAAPDAR